MAKDVGLWRPLCLHIRKRLDKAGVAKAKIAEMDASYEKLESRNAEKFFYRLVKAMETDAPTPMG